MHCVWIDNNRLDLYLYSWGYTKIKKMTMLSCARSLGANQRLYLTIAAGYKMTTEVLIAVAFPADFHHHSLVPFACRN